MTKDLFKTIRLPQSIFFIIFTLIGIAVSDIYDTYYVILKILIIFFLWQYTVIVNRIYDEKITGKKDFFVALLLLAGSLILSFISGIVFLILSALYIIAGTAYSVPPFRMRNYTFSTLFIGIGSVLAFLIGYYANFSTPFTYQILIYCIMIFIATSLGSAIKDLKDYEKDKEDGIRNIFTVFGPKRGKRISYILLLITFLVPSLLFSLPADVLVFMVLGLISVWIFMKFEDFRPVMLLAFLVLLYCVLRLNGII